jgi:hypothetical protein
MAGELIDNFDKPLFRKVMFIDILAYFKRYIKFNGYDNG